MTNKPIAFLPFSLQSPPSLCRREAGEKEKRTGKRAKHDGKGKEIRAISIFFFFFCFFIEIPSGASAVERGVEWFGSWAPGVSGGPYRHQHCLNFRLI